jgi:hypothetical protein
MRYCGTDPIAMDCPAQLGSIRETILDDPPDIPVRKFMDFTLVYWDTQLKPGGNTNKRVWEKHHIRRFFSSQLAALWKIHPVLSRFDVTGSIQAGLAKRFERGGIEIVPLIVGDFDLTCELDIVMLRPDTPGNIILEGGDIDNRIKVLLDALRVPKDTNEMPLKSGEINPKRIYCLLEDDSLITAIRIKTDCLLVPDTTDKYEVCLSIGVSVKVSDPLAPYQFRAFS